MLPARADAAPAPGQPAAPAVTLRELPQALHATIDLAVRQGSSIARLQLSPVTLGSIQIQLEHTSEGLIAHVVTERPEAAATLQQAGGELRKALESGGTTLLRLDIQTGSDPRSFASRQGGASTAPAAPATSPGEETPAVTATATAPAHPSAGALVDIFA